MYRAPLTGGETTLLATNGLFGVRCVATTPSDILWSQGPELDRASLAGTAAPSAYPGAPATSPACVRTNASYVVFTSGGLLTQIRLSDGAHFLVSELFALSSDKAYFLEDFALWEAALGQTTRKQLVVSATDLASGVSGIAADDKGIYWGVRPSAAGPWSMLGCSDALCTGGPEKLGKDVPTFPTSFALTADSIFFFSPSQQAVYRLPR